MAGSSKPLAKAQIAKQHCEESDADTKNGDIHCHFYCARPDYLWAPCFTAGTMLPELIGFRERVKGEEIKKSYMF